MPDIKFILTDIPDISLNQVQITNITRKYKQKR